LEQRQATEKASRTNYLTLYPAIAASERISFRQVNRETGNRLRQQLVDSMGTGNGPPGSA